MYIRLEKSRSKQRNLKSYRCKTLKYTDFTMTPMTPKSKIPIENQPIQLHTIALKLTHGPQFSSSL